MSSEMYVQSTTDSLEMQDTIRSLLHLSTKVWSINHKHLDLSALPRLERQLSPSCFPEAIHHCLFRRCGQFDWRTPGKDTTHYSPRNSELSTSKKNLSLTVHALRMALRTPLSWGLRMSRTETTMSEKIRRIRRLSRALGEWSRWRKLWILRMVCFDLKCDSDVAIMCLTMDYTIYIRLFPWASLEQDEWNIYPSGSCCIANDLTLLAKERHGLWKGTDRKFALKDCCS